MTVTLDDPALTGSASSSDRTRRAVDGAGWLGLGAVVAKTSQTIVLLVFAALLAPSSFGLISLAAVLLNLTVVVAGLGTSTALVQMRGDAERAARTALTLALALGLALVAVVWVTAPAVADTLNLGGQGAEVLRGVVLCLPLAAASGVSAELLRRALEFRRRVVPDIVGNLVGAAVTILALVAGAGVHAFVIGQLTQAVLILVLFWLLRRPVLPGWSGTDARALLAFGGSLAGSSVLTIVVLNVDYILIANRLGAHEMGVYSMAFRLAYLPYLLIAMVIGGAAFAHLSRMRGPAVGRAAVDAALLMHALVVPLYTAILVLAPHLEVLGAAWAPAVPALRWLAGYGLLLSALEILQVALKSVGRTADILVLTALHLVLLFGLLWAYVDRGVTAAAICQVVAGAITVGGGALAVSRRVQGIDVALLLRDLWPVAAGAAALAVTAVGVQWALPTGPASPVGLLVAGSTSLAAYLVTVRALDPADRTGLARTLHLPRVALPPLGRARPQRVRTPGRVGKHGLVGGAVALAAVSAGALAVTAPVVALVAATAAGVLAAAAYRIEWVALLLVAAEPFGDLLREVHPMSIKAIGLLLFGSWALRVLVGGRPAVPRHPGIAAVGLLVLVLLASFVANGADLSVGMGHGLTYLAYALVVLVLVHTLREERATTPVLGRRLVTCYFLACTAASVVGVIIFLADGGRANGPLADPNDLAFFLVAAMPFAVVAAHHRPLALRWATAACVAVLIVGVFATLSRGAVLAVLVMAVVATALGVLRPRAAIALAAGGAAILATLWFTHGSLIGQSIAEKDHVASSNVDSRITAWTMAADMAADNPMLGKGPGGFAATAERFIPDGVAVVDETVVHNMYLDIAAELGLLGLLAFLAAVAYGIRGALRARRAPGRKVLADAVLIAFAGTLVAAGFLSEQFYLPIWLLIALGIALDPIEHASGRSGRW